MNAPLGSPPPDGAAQRWGLGEVALGILASFTLAAFVGAVIIGVAGWSPVGGPGSGVGQAIALAQQGTESEPWTQPAYIPVWGLALLQMPLWGGYLGAVLVAGRSRGGGIAHDFGLRSTPLDIPVGLLIGVVTQLLAVPLLYIPILSLTGTDSDELSAPARELASGADSTVGWILFALIVGLGAPVVEELFYRGLFLRALTKRGARPWVAVLLTSVVFAAVHLQGLQFAGLALFGLVAGVLTVRTGRLGPAIWAHIGFNLTTVVVLYLSS